MPSAAATFVWISAQRIRHLLPGSVPAQALAAWRLAVRQAYFRRVERVTIACPTSRHPICFPIRRHLERVSR
jgi:hypothetical protein